MENNSFKTPFCSNCNNVFDNSIGFIQLNRLDEWHSCFIENDNYIYVYFIRLSENKDDILILYIGKSNKDLFRFLHYLKKILVCFRKKQKNKIVSNSKFSTVLDVVLNENINNICITKLSTNGIATNEIEETFINEAFLHLNQILLLNRSVASRNLEENKKDDQLIYKIYDELRKNVYINRFIKLTRDDMEYLLSKKDDVKGKLTSYIDSCLTIDLNSTNFLLLAFSKVDYGALDILNHKLRVILKKNKKNFFQFLSKTMNINLQK